MNNQNSECVDITSDIETELKEKSLSDTTIKLERQCPQCSQLIKYKQIKLLNFDNENKIKCSNCYNPNGILPILIIINGTTNWKRICHRCGCDVIHKSNRHCEFSIKSNRPCRNCGGKIYRFNNDRIRNCPICKKEMIYDFGYLKKKAEEEQWVCKVCNGRRKKGIKFSEETKLKMSDITKTWWMNLSEEDKIKQKKKRHKTESSLEVNKKRKLANLGRKQSDEEKRKRRISHLKYIVEKNGNVRPGINKKACHYIDDYGYIYGYNFQHGLNGGEYHISGLGYFVDGYDTDKNVVFEYDESHHFNVNGTLREKDIKRMNEIKLHLNCKFIRYNEKLNQIKEY